MKIKKLLTEAFSFETIRLELVHWYHFEKSENALSISIQAITEPEVMKTLPENWQDLDTNLKRCQWIRDREKQSICLAVYLKDSRDLIGLVLLSIPEHHEKHFELRLGYLIASKYWGQGFASEIVKGLVAIAIRHENIEKLTGGVDSTNIASIKVLTKNGFERDLRHAGQATHFYRYLCSGNS